MLPQILGQTYQEHTYQEAHLSGVSSMLTKVATIFTVISAIIKKFFLQCMKEVSSNRQFVVYNLIAKQYNSENIFIQII